MEKFELGEDVRLLRPIERTGRAFWTAAAILLLIAAWGVFAYASQLRRGLAVTGLSVPVYWGLYITNFVFFIGISHAGTLISAILRLDARGMAALHHALRRGDHRPGPLFRHGLRDPAIWVGPTACSTSCGTATSRRPSCGTSLRSRPI